MLADMGYIYWYFQSLANLVKYGESYAHLNIAIFAVWGPTLSKMVKFEMFKKWL